MTASLLVLAPRVADAATGPGLPREWHRGANLTSWDPGAYGAVTGAEAIAALAQTGTSRVALVPTWYMADRTSSRVAMDPRRSPTDDSIRRAARLAHAFGMGVVMKPHVDVDDGTFRGDIDPTARLTWWASYRAMVLRYADMAEEERADMLVVGTELTSMSVDSAAWRALIAEARERFTGQLTFAANWIDGAERITFWDALDLIGVDAYMPLVEGDPNPRVETLVAAWSDRGYVRRLEQLAALARRPVVFTELGYRSRLGTAAAPADWSEVGGEVSQQPQARAYEAAFRVFAGQPWFRGIYWWDWSAQGWNSEIGDGSHRFAGKAAEGVVRTWNFAPPTPTPVAGVDDIPARGGGGGAAPGTVPERVSPARTRTRVVRFARGWHLLIEAPGCRAPATGVVGPARRGGPARVRFVARGASLRAVLPRRLRAGRYIVRARVGGTCSARSTRRFSFSVPRAAYA